MILFHTTIDLSVTFYECSGFTVVLATIKLPIQTCNFDCIYDLYLNCFFEGSANWNSMCVCVCVEGERCRICTDVQCTMFAMAQRDVNDSVSTKRSVGLIYKNICYLQHRLLSVNVLGEIA